MNYFELYPGDYLRDTTRLTLVEHGVYLKLLMTYYAEEQPLPAAHSELYTIAGAITAADKAAVRKIACKFFAEGPDGQLHNARADDEISKAQDRMEGGEEKSSNAAERQRRHRERRQKLFDVLRSAGITMPYNAPTADLEALVMDLAEHNGRNGPRNTVTAPVTPVTRHVTPSSTATRPQTPDPITTPDRSQHAERSLSSRTDAGRACRLMREAGCIQSNPSHTDLLAALAEGVTPETLADTVREGLAKERPPTKPFTWAIATARSRRANGPSPINGATHAASPHAGKLSLADRSAAETARRNRQGGDDIEGEAVRVAG